MIKIKAVIVYITAKTGEQNDKNNSNTEIDRGV